MVSNLRQSVFRLALLAGPLVPASAGTVDPGAPGAAAGVFSSATMVEGRPAIAYSTSGSSAVKFVRALDAGGHQWGAPVVVEAGQAIGGKVCLEVVNGFPAVCYFDGVQQRLKYVRATDAAGGSWASPVVLDAGGIQVSGYSLAEVEGRPAVCLDRAGSGGLQFLRAANAGGTLWGSPVTLENTGSGFEPCLRLVAGNPAVAYFAAGKLRFTRAVDGAGTSWPPAVVVGDAASGGNHGLALAVINGRPAVTFVGSGELMYNRAGDAAGAAWGTPFSPNSVTIPQFQIRDVQSTTLASIGGKPAIGYYTTTAGDLSFMLANDGEGSTRFAWGPPLTVDTLHDTGKAPVLLDAGGLPAFSYHDVTAGSLEFLRAVAGGESYHWRTEIQVKTSDGVVMPVNGTLLCNSAVPGFAATTNLLISSPNSGSGVLKDFVFTVDGPDAAEFMVIEPAPPVIDPGSAAWAYVVYKPVTPGVKHAVLHIASNAERPSGPYHINLTAQSLPMLTVEYPVGTVVPGGGSLLFPVPAPGNAGDVAITIRNTGMAALENIAFSVTGPDAAGFFILPAAAGEPVAPGESVVIPIRHTRSSAGRKTAVLHIASNAAGAPYDLNLNSLPGNPDRSFNPATADITAMAVQGDGRIVTGGRGFVARLHPDGSLDTGFAAQTLDGHVDCIAVQKDGRILLGGTFTAVGGASRRGVARLLPDGNVDSSFNVLLNPYPSSIVSVAVQGDGKILVGGIEQNTESRRIFRRINPDGSADEGFYPAGPGASVSCLGITSKGRILAGGRSASSFPDFLNYEFLQLSGEGIQQGGTLRLSSGPACVAELADGSVLAGGDNILFRQMPGGTSGQVPAMTGAAAALAPQVDGQCVLTGNFLPIANTVSSHLARIRAGGFPDPDFQPESAAPVWDAVLQADGKLLIAGGSREAGVTGFTKLARLENDPASSRLRAVNGSGVQWLRGGSAPEVRDVTFDVKADGAPAWTPLGTAQRIPGGWGLSGISLPASGQLRAQGYAGGSVIEAIAPVVTPLETWRLSYFGTAENAGAAADDSDPDGDGLTNFAEFAFGLHPLDPKGGVLPEFHHGGGFLQSSFTVPEGRGDILYAAEWSPDLKAGTWLPAAQTGSAPGIVFRVPADGKSAFVRFVIRAR